MTKVEKMTKMKIPASHNKSGYVIRYFCPRCGGDMLRPEWSPGMSEDAKNQLHCGDCGYEENKGHFRKGRMVEIPFDAGRLIDSEGNSRDLV